MLSLAELFIEMRDAHRKEYCDMEWDKKQPRKTSYYIGDVVEFKVGGIGVLSEAKDAHNGWAPSYSCSPVKGFSFHKEGKTAWHLEGDFKRLIAGSGIRYI